MCCIFTCCGWMIDLVQRAWVFAMSCCISSAVSCFFITSSMAGVAMGYNYSLAEYIELKETNVSVFLKRGVFDDEVINEMDWRRGGGGLPAAERSGPELTETPSSVPDFPFGYRRANDEGLFATTQINQPNDLYGNDPDHNRFEGSLLKLTSKPKNYAGDQIAQDPQIQKAATAYPDNSMEQLKAVQGLMNRRKLEEILQSGVNKGFMMPNPITDSTSSVPPEGAGTSPAWGVSDEMQLIQKLLNEQKEIASRHDKLRKTTKKTTQRPWLTGSIPDVFPMFMGGPSQARRMGNLDKSSHMDPLQTLEDNLKTIIKDSPKWYYQKPTDIPMTIWTSSQGPVTITNFITRTKLKLQSTTPLSQDSFRRAMQEASNNKDRKENEVQSNIINGPPTEPQKDYDEEDVKGIPVRRKRKKRNRRNILDSPTEVTKQSIKKQPITDKASLGNKNSVFRNLMAILMNFKLIFATEGSPGAKVLSQSLTSETLPTASSAISNTDIVASSYINVGASTTDALRAMRIIKSTVAAF